MGSLSRPLAACLLLLASAAFTGCTSPSAGVAKDSGVGAEHDGSVDAGMDGGRRCTVTGSFVRFLWERLWGPCPPGHQCIQRLIVGFDCQATFNDQWTMRSATLVADDCSRAKALVSEGAVLDAVCDGAPCPQLFDLWENVTVELSGGTVQKDIAGCEGEPYRAIRDEVQRLRGKYFP